MDNFKVRVKKHQSGNEYIRAGNAWIRNFTKNNLVPLQITHMFSTSDYSLVIQNENFNKSHSNIANEHISFKKIVIVSDGYNFQEKHKLLANLPRDVGILAINGALSGWTLMSPKLEQRRAINAYVINNPYAESLRFLPNKESKYYPVCISSSRTNGEFLKKYLGDIYIYSPTSEEYFGHIIKEQYHVDDYRNPICAAIGLAYQFGAERLLLYCCDESFKEKRDLAVELENELWTYPEHLRAKEIIDANLYWFTHQEDKEVKVADHSSCGEYDNAVYIKNKEEIVQFFEQE